MSVVKTMRENFMNVDRVRFDKPFRLKLYKQQGKCCQLCKNKLEINYVQIDHIKALANGGTNDIENLQILCKPCHYVKTKDEAENGWVKESDTQSSFNSQTDVVFNSELSKVWAFVEKVEEDDKPTISNRNEEVLEFMKQEKIVRQEEGEKVYWARKKAEKEEREALGLEEGSTEEVEVEQVTAPKLFGIDINKCRKNEMLHNKFNYPLFTVMDKIEIYNGDYTRPGLYNVETDNYFPLRGNGWYSEAMISYCLETNIITEANIKQVIYSSLEVKHDYFNKLINHL